MSHRKAKTAPKIFEVQQDTLKKKVLKTMSSVADAVGRTMGPGGRNILIESDFPGIPNKNTKDGVTVFKSLGAIDPYEHLIIEQARDVAQRTASEAGDGTTTATVLAHAIIKNLFDYCEKNRKESPQRVARKIQKITREMLVPYVNSRAIQITDDNKHMLKMVAKISANGDDDMADAVIKAFEEIGYGDASHVTIRELSGPQGYKVERIDGFPIPMGYEDSIGKFHTAFINDQANQRVYLENPLFILYDGMVNDLIQITPLLNQAGEKFQSGESDYKNIVIVAHGFSENVLTMLAVNWADPGTMNVFPLVTPMAQFVNSQLHFQHDLAAFTGASVFGLTNQIGRAELSDLGKGMTSFECNRFRSTVVGDPDSSEIEARAADLETMKANAESQAETIWIEERLGKITNGIAKLTIFGGSNGELKEAHDRCEDAVCAVRSAITHGALPGGCRLSIDMACKLSQELPEGDAAREVLVPSLLALPHRLLENAGYSEDEIQEVLARLLGNPEEVYDIENQAYGKAEDLGLFDATKAVSESLSNAVSIAAVLGTMGGMVCHPRDDVFERSEAKADAEFTRVAENPHNYTNEANQRP
jgi:chaperonin GroEL